MHVVKKVNSLQHDLSQFFHKVVTDELPRIEFPVRMLEMS